MSKVLEEASSVAQIIELFNKEDQNPYKDIKKIILDIKLKKKEIHYFCKKLPHEKNYTFNSTFKYYICLFTI